MTVSLGPIRLLGTSTLLGASQVLGQGNTNTAHDVEWELLFSTDDAAVSIPSWTFLSQMRGFTVNRGRGSELDDVDAGTASITLDNRSRAFDPTNASGAFYPNLRPMNRVWLRMRFNGITHDLFKGWVESYEQQYPESGLDAVTVVHAVDEFKVLALRNQPTSDPPRETYADVVQFDKPAGYWQMKDDPVGLAEQATAGPGLRINTSVAGNTISAITDTAISGENPEPFGALQVDPGKLLESEVIETYESFDWSGLTTGSVSFWFKVADATPTAAAFLVEGMGTIWRFTLNTTGTLAFYVINNSSTTFTATSIATITDNTWTHACGVLNGSGITLYINGSVAATASFSGVVKTPATATNLAVGPYNSASATTVYYNHLAVYRTALTADRVTAHYNAGANRGYAQGQNPGERIGHILDAISSQAPRNVRAGARPMSGQWTGNGQATLEALREAENAEAVDAVTFIAGDGTVTFLDGAHRSTSPWNTVQATFGDAGGTELDFTEIQVDYSDSFIANSWNVTRDGGTVQSASDTTSINAYLERSQSLTGLKLRDDSDAANVATDMLAKYKDPLMRVLSIAPNCMKTDVIDAVFPLEIGDRINVKLTPLGGGARFDQTLFVQSIAIDVTAAQVYPRVMLGVSPV